MARMSTADRVFASLRQSIVAGEFPPGSLHSIYRLAELLGVSRTPVRDAVLRLADLGLVTIERNRGVRIRGVTVADVRSAFELRLMLEVPAAAMAATSADAEAIEAIGQELTRMRRCAAEADESGLMLHDRQLHQAISAVMANPRLQTEISTLSDSIQARGALTIDRSRGMAEVAEEHAPIVEAIVLRDPDGAAGHMAQHLVHTATLLMRQVAAEDEVIDEQWAYGLLARLLDVSTLATE